ncbi:MAG: site-specific DNA-methyltransferase [Clostridiales bacterium]|jgi:DNA modification methylase|nr:site-specific DNA-methyltransferase [Clostridiales bacterium]MDR2751960.1 site-specific DNA-methyltransferase [Clostridiales bacterium]
MISEYLAGNSVMPFFICGDAIELLKRFPAESIDMAITSPPYWGKRAHGRSAIEREEDFVRYTDTLMSAFSEVLRVLKPTGSFWLNIGDSYSSKRLMGVPWRIALKMCDEQDWLLRNSVVWNKLRGNPDNSKDKLRGTHEMLFHFVKQKKYYYDISMARKDPLKARSQDGSVISASGVNGSRYKKQIEMSPCLTKDQKRRARSELDVMLKKIENGELADFRMIIKGQQKATHSGSVKLSGRARELESKGYYFLKYHPDGAKLGDVWDITAEASRGERLGFAPFPEELCRTPILATCPPDGIVLDPFCGTGTAMSVAFEHGRKSIGIDISQDCIDSSRKRIIRLSTNA